MKPEYGPTLGRLLEPRWRAARPATRVAVLAGLAAVVALALALVLQLQSASYAHGGPVPFSFKYKGLYRATPDAGAYVKVRALDGAGAPRYSYEVYPLRLAAYEGSPSGALPSYASGYIAQLRARSREFVLRGEGKTRVNTVPGYHVLYTAQIEGRTMWGRDVLLLPERPGVREGVDIVMLTSPTANAQITSPLEVATAGVLLRPLKTFTFE